MAHEKEIADNPVLAGPALKGCLMVVDSLIEAHNSTSIKELQIRNNIFGVEISDEKLKQVYNYHLKNLKELHDLLEKAENHNKIVMIPDHLLNTYESVVIVGIMMAIDLNIG